MKFVLASASPRRKELLAELIEKFEIIPAKGEEIVDDNLTPSELVKSLALQKATEVASVQKDKIVLGADTVVALGNRILGKPKDEADAVEMLTALSGRAHEVYTGVCLIVPKAERIVKVDVACTKVYFNRLTREDIVRYVASGSPMDKAGAYGIQDGGLVEKIEGSYSNVVGLPVELCRELFEKLDIK